MIYYDGENIFIDPDMSDGVYRWIVSHLADILVSSSNNEITITYITATYWSVKYRYIKISISYITY